MTEDLDPTLDSGSQPTVPSSMDGGGFGDFADPNQLEGQILGDFRLLHEIGRGGMGIVHKAEQLSLQRPVALKILPAQLTMNERALERFKREASITAQLVHRNIVDIYAVGEALGVHFIAMELVQGSNLEQLIQRMRGEDFGELSGQAIRDIVSVHPLHGNLDSNLDAKQGSGSKLREVTPSPRKATSSAHSKNYVESVVKLVAQIADGLHHAHQAGVIHRDIKPANILVRADGTPVLTDFGLARAEGLPNVSATGEFAGTPNYVSPEQAMAHRIPVDHRTDIFSLGATLYELLTLELAFGGDSIHTVLQKIISKEVRDPHKLNPILAPDLVTIIYKTLEKDPDRRYQTAEEFAEDLRAFASYRPIHATRTPTIVRAFRWMRREPLKAAGILGVSVGLPAVAVLTAVLRSQQGELQASRARDQAMEIEDEVAELLDRAFQALAEREDETAIELFEAALEKDPGSVRGRVGLSLGLVGTREFEDALEAVTPTGDEVDHAALDFQRAEILRYQGDVSEADRILAGLGEPETPLERYLRAMSLLRESSLNTFFRRGVSRTQYDVQAAGERAETARGLLNKVCRDEPTSAHAYFAYAWSLWATGQYDEGAIDHMREKWGDRPATHFWIGVVLRNVDFHGAVASFDRVLELDPGNRSARKQKALLAMNRGDFHDAGMLEEQVAVFRSLIDENPTYAADHAVLAVALFGLERYEEAVDACRRAIAIDPKLAEAYDTLGTSLHRLHQFEDARDAFERALELNPASPEVMSDLGYTQLALEDVDQAIDTLQAAAVLDPSNAINWCNLGKALGTQGDLDQAKDAYQKAVSTDGALALARAGLGNVLSMMGQHFEAIESCQEAVGLEPENAEHQALLGYVLATAGRFDEAAIQYENAIDLDPFNDDYYLHLQSIHSYRGRADDNVRLLTRRVERMPDNPVALNELAWILLDPDTDPSLRDPAQALELSRRAVDASQSNNYAFLDTYASALFENGRVLEAIRYQERAVELFEGDPSGKRSDGEDLLDHLDAYESAR